MSTATSLRGDICPSWCDGEDHFVDRERRMHPEDCLVVHTIQVDSWVPTNDGTPQREQDAVIVALTGSRHDNGRDWPDRVEILGGCNDGMAGGVSLEVDDARRLGLALLRAVRLAATD